GMSNWQAIFVEPAKTVLAQVGQFLVNVLLVIIILIIGWIISKVLKGLVTKLLKSVKLDDLSDRIELDDLLAKGGITYTLSELLGVIIYWLCLLITFVVAINAIGLTVAADLLNKIILYVPHIIAGIFIMVLGMFVATLLRNIVHTAASNAGLSQAKLLSNLVEIVVIIFTVLITLEQLDIGAKIIELTITVVLASLGLGLALAFGLGCKDMAAKFLSDVVEKTKGKK
ncbi:MAG: hypothetical protein PHN57_04990, partial [Candidatus Omnitrophica bacterium]|nr:hypothetical protein [Candidatus Omnitrophota bacterium]